MEIKISSKHFIPGQNEQIDSDTGNVVCPATVDTWDFRAEITSQSLLSSSTFRVCAPKSATDTDLINAAGL